MATIGHIAAGIAIGRAGGAGRDKLAMAVVTAASVSPDIDLVLGINHRGPTHSITFAVLAAVGSALVVHAARHPRPGAIAIMAFAAVVSHIVLDFLTVRSSIAVLWPFTPIEFVLGNPLLPSVPLDERILSLAGVLDAAAEFAWSAMLIVVGIWIGARRRDAAGAEAARD